MVVDTEYRTYMYVVFVMVLFHLIARSSTVTLLLFRLVTASAVCWAILPWWLLVTRSRVIILLFRPLDDQSEGDQHRQQAW